MSIDSRPEAFAALTADQVHTLNVAASMCPGSTIKLVCTDETVRAELLRVIQEKGLQLEVISLIDIPQDTPLLEANSYDLFDVEDMVREIDAQQAKLCPVQPEDSVSRTSKYIRGREWWNER